MIPNKPNINKIKEKIIRAEEVSQPPKPRGVPKSTHPTLIAYRGFADLTSQKQVAK